MTLIINSPYTEPSGHWKFVEEGLSLELAEGRREAGYRVADPGAKPHQDKGIFVPLPLVNQIRPRVAAWRDSGYPGVTGITKAFQVFFPMADGKSGWKNLAKNLKAEIDADLMEAYRGTVSLPFELGENSRIAVKIVDDRGIESLKVITPQRRRRNDESNV